MTNLIDQDIPSSGDAHSIPSFCLANNISISFFHKLRKAGNGPRIMKVGSRTLITKEAAAEWRKQMEERTAQAAA